MAPPLNWFHLLDTLAFSLLLIFLGLFTFNLFVVNLGKFLVFFSAITIILLLLFFLNYISLSFVLILNTVPLAGILLLLLLFPLLKMFNSLHLNYAHSSYYSSLLQFHCPTRFSHRKNAKLIFIKFFSTMCTFLQIFFISSLPLVCLFNPFTLFNLIPFARTSVFLHSFVPSTCSAWNSLPFYLKDCPSLSSFVFHLHNHTIPSCYYCCVYIYLHCCCVDL